ncbi:MAG: dienelactone hydrolase family protein [Rhizobacter sp.]|nr:dienelactone hydrolase family protein [Ferruginibacter sp.]
MALIAYTQDLSLYKKEWLILGTDTLPYRVLLPENYQPAKKYPVIFFLHGSGERGNDNEKQLQHGAKLFLTDSLRKNYPAIVIFPQCSEKSFWSNVAFKMDTVTKKRSFEFSATAPPTVAMKLLLELTDKILKDFPVKKGQVYVMGLSMGGMGTFEIVNRKQGLYAAAIPICGGGDAATAGPLSKTNWWVFHGAKDDVVLPVYSDIMVAALKKGNALVKYTLYPDANHNSWDAAFAEPDLLHWLFNNKKK